MRIVGNQDRAAIHDRLIWSTRLVVFNLMFLKWKLYVHIRSLARNIYSLSPKKTKVYRNPHFATSEKGEIFRTVIWKQRESLKKDPLNILTQYEEAKMILIIPLEESSETNSMTNKVW